VARERRARVLTASARRASAPGAKSIGQAPGLEGVELMNERADPELFIAAMRLTASGVSVITTDGPHGAAGLTVSTLQSLSTEPPSIVVCVNRASRSLAALLANGHFVANVLSAGQADIATTFASPSDRSSKDKFLIGRWCHMVSGAPALEGALCNIDCRVADVFAFGSHKIVVGSVLSIISERADPLIYSNRSYRRLCAAEPSLPASRP
jgi:flavin reductase (DIM6/NTAB) family NADH-FMN oxidoreductase RutF